MFSKNYLPISKSGVAVLAASSLLVACQSSTDSLSSTDDGARYKLLSMKHESGTFNASASKSAIIPHKVTNESLPEDSNYVAENEDSASDASDNSDAVHDQKKAYRVKPSEEVVYFKFDSSELTDSAKSSLDDMIDSAGDVENAEVTVNIAGHTDSMGSDAYNQQLSLQRAETVKNYLDGQLTFAKVEWDMDAYGEDKPVADNDTMAGRQENRRVHLKISAKGLEGTAMAF